MFKFSLFKIEETNKRKVAEQAINSASGRVRAARHKNNPVKTNLVFILLLEKKLI